MRDLRKISVEAVEKMQNQGNAESDDKIPVREELQELTGFGFFTKNFRDLE